MTSGTLKNSFDHSDYSFIKEYGSGALHFTIMKKKIEKKAKLTTCDVVENFVSTKRKNFELLLLHFLLNRFFKTRISAVISTVKFSAYFKSVLNFFRTLKYDYVGQESSSIVNFCRQSALFMKSCFQNFQVFFFPIRKI